MERIRTERTGSLIMDVLLSIKEVCQSVKLGKTSIYKLEKEGRFPNRVKMGVRCTRWRKSDIDKYIAGL